MHSFCLASIKPVNMKALFILILAIPLMTGCEKSFENAGDNNDLDLKGRFLGTFHRTGGETANISILFSENSFEGDSDKMKYPAICNGTFTVNNDDDRINFDNACAWSADFDWTLILDGTYNFVVNPDKSLIISRTYENNIRDEYKLYRVTK